MSKDNDGKSLKASGLTLDTKTKSLDLTTKCSTEPEKEPWSQPPSGYKWYVTHLKQVVMAAKRRRSSAKHTR